MAKEKTVGGSTKTEYNADFQKALAATRKNMKESETQSTWAPVGECTLLVKGADKPTPGEFIPDKKTKKKVVRIVQKVNFEVLDGPDKGRSFTRSFNVSADKVTKRAGEWKRLAELFDASVDQSDAFAVGEVVRSKIGDAVRCDIEHWEWEGKKGTSFDFLEVASAGSAGEAESVEADAPNDDEETAPAEEPKKKKKKKDAAPPPPPTEEDDDDDDDDESADSDDDDDDDDDDD